ncbi:MFS transporter [Burkholderia territorii]|uniref:MFS transporter n=1 Tax=Burkholderia territorii TaxID=1503055 RepID=A0A6L3NN88_9BURK|nr:MFS transporter [Burkholderia territorii]KAB0686338.1 MFS transporter [Burkholderia territorii]MBM2775954.1 MFS transporter [Burkholderia territorii]VWB48652.1 major facilitator family transporter [Burkholderia territorii]
MAHSVSSPQFARRVSKKLVVATVAGNAMEFYDFVTYAFFAIYIGKTFFPASTPSASLLLSVAVFGVGFLARPLGGVLIGAFADRAGRKPAMLLTIGLISIGTLGLALTPAYSSIGMAAPVIVVACRLVQGLALGGEVGPSTAYLIEISPPTHRGLYTSWQLASQGMAVLIAGVIGLAVILCLTPEQTQAWGWRLPFAAGLLLLPIGLFLRRYLPESLPRDAHVANEAGLAALKQHRNIIVLSMLAILGGTIATYVINFMTTFAISSLKLSPAVAMSATIVNGLFTLVFSVLGGWMTDRWGRKPVMLWPRLIASLLAVPTFLWMTEAPSLGSLLASTGLLTMLSSMSGSAVIIGIPEMLPQRIRATGLSVAYALSVSVFGGSAQFVVTWLINITGNAMMPAWYMFASGLIAVAGTIALPESRGRSL